MNAHPEVVRLSNAAKVAAERLNALRKQYPDLTTEALEDSVEFKDVVAIMEELRRRPDVLLGGDVRTGNITVLASPYNPKK